MSLCLFAGAVAVSLGAGEVTLAWRHSVQKTLWEEVWTQTPAGLSLTEARVEGSGAGMDPPEGSALRDGFWRWRPNLPPLTEVVMRRSGATADWSVCVAASCRPMAALVPPDADPVRLAACPADQRD